MGHGAQKLFGWFGGHGLAGTAGWLESLGLRPGKPWALMAGASEFAGGALLVLGFLNPLGPIAVMAAMLTAWTTAHRGKPIWATEGGGELALTNLTVALALALSSPGAYSLDAALGINVPTVVTVIVAVGAVVGVVATIASRVRAVQARQVDRAA